MESDLVAVSEVANLRLSASKINSQHAKIWNELVKCKEDILKNANQLQNHEAVLPSMQDSTSAQPQTPPAVHALLDVVESLMTEWSKTDTEVKEHNSRLNDLDQYGRKNCILIKKLKNIPSNLKGHAFSRYIVDVINNALGGYLDHTLSYLEIDAAHPLPNPKGNDYPPTTVIVKFICRNTRNDVFYKKRFLKKHSSNISITEHLTNYNSKLLNKSKEKFGPENAWSDEGKIRVFLNGTNKITVKTIEEVEQMEVPPDHIENCQAARNKYHEKQRVRYRNRNNNNNNFYNNTNTQSNYWQNQSFPAPTQQPNTTYREYHHQFPLPGGPVRRFNLNG